VGEAEGVPDAEAAGAVVVLLAVADALVVLLAVAPAVDPPGVHAANAAAAVPAPRNNPSERRLMSVERSNSRPRSWLGCGS
jgi:hypothetical protein